MRFLSVFYKRAQDAQPHTKKTSLKRNISVISNLFYSTLRMKNTQATILNCTESQGDWKKYLNASKQKDFFQKLQKGEEIEWITKLKNNEELPPPPNSFSIYLEEVAKHGVKAATERIFQDVIINAPVHVSNYFSGNSEKALSFSERESSHFMAKLFHYIKNNSPVEVNLCGWDLYHGHYFIHLSEIDDNNENDEKISNNEIKIEEEKETVKLNGDFAILFHAKEFPKEYRSSKYAMIQPIGSPGMRGEFDPRLGSKFSVKDSDFPLRNYLYLLSTNSVYLFNPLNPNFPMDLLSDTEFYTITEYRFTAHPLGNINYFPHLYKKDHLKLREEGCEPKTIIDFDAAAENVLASPVHMTSLMNIKNQLYKLYSTIRAAHSDDLLELLNDLEKIKPSHQSSSSIFTPSEIVSLPQSIEFIRYLAELRRNDLISQLAPHNQSQLNEMIKKGFSEDDANIALKLTADSEGKFSSFRGEIFSTIIHAKYRDAELLKISNEDYHIDDAYVVWKETFYVDTSLEALKYSSVHNVSLHNAASIILKKRNDELVNTLKEDLDRALQKEQDNNDNNNNNGDDNNGDDNNSNGGNGGVNNGNSNENDKSDIANKDSNDDDKSNEDEMKKEGEGNQDADENCNMKEADENTQKMEEDKTITKNDSSFSGNNLITENVLLNNINIPHLIF